MPHLDRLDMTVSHNSVPGVVYFDASGSVKITPQLEAFVSVDNIVHRAPEQVAFGRSIGVAPLSPHRLLTKF